MCTSMQITSQLRKLHIESENATLQKGIVNRINFIYLGEVHVNFVFDRHLIVPFQHLTVIWVCSKSFKVYKPFSVLERQPNQSTCSLVHQHMFLLILQI